MVLIAAYCLWLNISRVTGLEFEGAANAGKP